MMTRGTSGIGPENAQHVPNLKNEETVLEPVTEYVRNLTRSRASTVNLKCVKDLAADPDTVEFMEYIHGGRRAFPFQTLNFKVGTQQGFHSDLTFFDTQPRTLMAAAWVALEDTNPNNGPLKFVPKSHRYGIWDFNDIGLPYKYDIGDSEESRSKADGPYYIELAKIIKKMGFETKLADDIKRGQTFIWAAALVHGGAPARVTTGTQCTQILAKTKYAMIIFKSRPAKPNFEIWIAISNLHSPVLMLTLKHL
eukprot:694608-Ditylum_brightwellii.AAC.1